MPLWMIVDEVRRIAGRSEVAEIYVGRTADLSATQRRHGADRIIPLAFFDSSERAKRTERAAIAATIGHPKSSNEAMHSGGGTSAEYGDYLYVCIWLRRRQRA